MALAEAVAQTRFPTPASFNEQITELDRLLLQALDTDDEDLAELVLHLLEDAPPGRVSDLVGQGGTRVASVIVEAYSLENTDVTEVPARFQNRDLTADQRKVITALWPLKGGAPSAAPTLPTFSGAPLTSITTIVHGTGAKHQTWWQPKGSFASLVQARVTDFYQYSDFFSWSGTNRHTARVGAATALRRWVDIRLRKGGELTLICHSHGGNIAMLAARDGLRINKLILLGTPIRTDYATDMTNIEEIRNFYVPWDAIQRGGTIWRRRGEGRTLADTDKIINRPVMAGVGGAKRSHSDLHDWNVWTNPSNGLDGYL